MVDADYQKAASVRCHQGGQMCTAVTVSNGASAIQCQQINGNGAKDGAGLRVWKRTEPLRRGPAAAQKCAFAFFLALAGTAQANQRPRPASS
jgi:hypothetical protein